MSTHNLCFGIKIRKIVHPCITQLYCIKVGYEGPVGVYVSLTFSCYMVNVCISKSHTEICGG